MSQDFWEKVLLLLATAVVTGFAVPFVLKRIEERRARDQKRFEAELARQGKVIEAQVKLIEDLAAVLWDFQLSIIEVLYYRQFSKDLYERAMKKYQEASASQLGRVRAEISKAIRLVPTRLYEELKQMYYGDLLDADLKLSTLTKDESKPDEINAFTGKSRSDELMELHRYLLEDLSEKVDTMIDRLSSELNLKAPS